MLEGYYVSNKTNDLEKVGLTISVIVSGVLVSAVLYICIEWISSKRLKKTTNYDHNHFEHVLNLTNDHENMNA